MTPKEFELLCSSLEFIAEQVYQLGKQDQASGKSLKENSFRMTKAERLQLKTLFSKAQKGVDSGPTRRKNHSQPRPTR